MGKLEKKKTPLEGDKQVKISAFFQAGGPVKSKLFSSVGNVPKPAKQTLNKSTLPAKPFEGEACKKHFTPEARQICDKTNKFTSISVQNCMPPNKADVTKGTNHKFLSPERSAKMADPVSASPDVVMIPDTPEEKQKFHPPKKKVFTSRSFLTTSVSPISRDPPPKIVKKRKSKLDGMVSVMFNEPGAQTKEHNFDVNENNEAVLDLDVKSDSVTPTKEYKSDRVKRLAKSGLSPTPKRSLCLDSEVLLGSGTGFNFSSTEDKSASTEKKILPKHKKTNVEKILSHMSRKPFADQKGLNKKLHNYQIGGSKHESPSKLELSSDDDILGKILGELGSKSCSKSASRFREKAKIPKSDTVAKSVCHVEDTEEEKAVLNELLNELGPKCSGRTKIVKGSSSSGPIARKDLQKSATVMGAMTAEERKLFKTLDDSFGSSTGEMMSDSESPSIIMPKRRQRDAKAPVESLFKDFKNNESADGGDRDLVRMTDEVDGVEELIDDKESGQSDDSVDGGDVKLADDMSPRHAEQEFADFKETGSAKKENDVEHVMTDVTSGPESQELCSEFTHLTPFAEDMSFSEVCELPPSCRPADRFNRFRVSSVQHNRDETILNLMKDEDVKSVQSCILHGFWLDTHVAEGDIVHILGNFDVDGVCHITDQVGLIVICPDLLLSGTSVVSGVHCMRRSVLNEKFKGCDDKSIHMLFGSVIHCLFQQVLKQGLSSKSQIQDTAKSVMMLNKFLHEMYSHVTHETVVQEEIDKYIVPLQKWLEKYSTLCPQTNNAASSDAKVSKVHDIEENIWSPRFGVKGKIDLTVEIEMPDRKGKKILPLELKTGKPTFSIEHKGQVTLYSMMMSDRRADPEEGLLLYLREPVMTSVAVKGDNKRGLIQLRNELAHYVSRQVSKTVQDGHSTFQYGPLPKPINSVRTCSKCPQLVNCSIYQSQVEHLSHHKGHAMESLVPETLQHLQQTHLDYFLHWSLCLELEGQVERGRSVKDIWCQSSQQREKTGDCLSGMVIRHTEVGMVTDSQRYAESDSCIITFVRHPEHARYYPSPLHTLGFAVNDTIAISTDDGRLLVLSTGFIRELREREVVIVVDRDIFHEDKELKKMTFRLDRCDNFNTLGYLFTNLSRLMANQGSREKLRQLIIDKKKPEFQLTMSKGTVEQVKPIFKSLNKPQKTAILKILMSKDYVLIRGFPGTGKTSTIVALVRILTSLGQSVLLTSYTHSAVDNILLKLKQHNVEFLRLGRLGRIHPEISEYSAELLTSKITSVHELRQFYDSQRVVATSCLGTNHPVFSQRRFDVCIVDEASQVLQPACLGPLFAADKFVLVGDPKQLPPVVQSKEARELGMSESLFNHLDDMGATFDLNWQYRMNTTIMHLSNELVYGGLLKCGSSTVAESTLPLMKDARVEDVLHESPWLLKVLNQDLDQAAVFLDTQQVPAKETCDGKGLLKNVVEADLVLIIIRALLTCGVDGEDIGVIAPYRHQVKYLQQRVFESRLVGVEVNTVDQYQGRDKSVIIMSFVRSSTNSSKSGELLQDTRRLNVAVTRAKCKLILVGDVATLRLYEPLKKIISTMEDKKQIYTLPPNAHR